MMKELRKIFVVILCAVMMIISFGVTATAYSEQDGFLYGFIDNSHMIEIVGISDNGIWADKSDIVLPYSLRGVSVIQVGKSAFANNRTVEHICMTENILQIGDEAMYGMKALKSIALPKYLEILGKNAFGCCPSLESVDFETTKLQRIQEFTFYGCTKLNNVIISSSVRELEDYCFGHCMSLDKIYIPSSVGKIAQTAFYSTKSGLTIYGENNSTAQRYAQDNGIAFVDVSEKDLDGLRISLSTADYWLNHADKALYTEESVTALQTAYQNAVLIKDNVFSTPEEIEDIITELDNCYCALRLKSMDTLDTLIAQAENKMAISFCYSEKSVSELNTAILQAKKIQNTVLPTETQVQTAIQNLTDKINALVEVLIRYDINNDGKVTLSDVVLVQKKLIGDEVFSQTEIYLVDFNNDSHISLADIILFQRYLLTR